MWHAFDIIAGELDLTSELRNAQADGPRKLVYSERVVRWFSDKSGKGQWPAVVDQRPGIVIEIPQKAHAESEEWTLQVEHARLQGVPVTASIGLACSATPWRSPRRWDVTQLTGDNTAGESLDQTTEQGEWDGTHITREIQGSNGRVIRHKYSTHHPCSVYPLLASFPLADLQSADPAGQVSDGLFTEAMQYTGGATFTKGAPGNANEHPLAKDLTCYRLTPSMGFPLEFWVNKHGVVVYLIEAATRAWLLQSAEAVS